MQQNIDVECLDSHLTGLTAIYSLVFSCLLTPYLQCPMHCQ